MKKWTRALLAVIITLICLIWLPNSSSLAQTKSSTARVKPQKNVKLSARIKETIKGSVSPEEIPDEVAYELLFRTLANNNAKGLLSKSKLTEEEIDTMMDEAGSINDSFEAYDQMVMQLKESSALGTLTLPLGSELVRVKNQKNGYLSRTIDRFLPQDLKGDMPKMRIFLKNTVKANIQKIVLKDQAVSKTQRSAQIFANSFAPDGKEGDDPVYLYSAAWHDGYNVYGSGSVYESVSTDMSYKVTVSVSSSGSRFNSTESDWSYATAANDTGLSIGIEDGNYGVNINFEEQNGYYDGYGNFYGEGSSTLGTSAETLFVGPQISLPSVDPATEFPLHPGDQKTFKVAVQATGGVPAGTAVTIEFNETSNFTPVAYDVDDRSKTLNISGSTTISEPFLVHVNSSSLSGTVGNKGRIGALSVPSGGAAVNVVGDGQSAEMKFNVSPQPQSSCSNIGAQTRCALRGYEWDFETCTCSGGCDIGGGCSPIVIDTAGNGFEMTSADNGVMFDIDGVGFPMLLSWLAPNSDDAWLALDRNHNGKIDDGKELFGNYSEQPAGQNPKQGFATLGMFDSPSRGGNGDGKITRKDAIFKKLRLWRDINHNGISEAEELFRLPALNVVALRLDYSESYRTDGFGNQFRYRAHVRDGQGSDVGRWAWDVFLVPSDQ
jgi:hypothetical protein